MSTDSAAQSGEERLIARYFAPLAKHPGALGLTDDAAAITPPAGCDLVLKVACISFPMIRPTWSRKRRCG